MNQTVEALAKKEATATEIINWYIPAIFSLLHHFMKPWVLADRTHTQQLSHFKTKNPREAPPHPTTEEVSSTLWRPLTHHPCSPRTPVFFLSEGSHTPKYELILCWNASNPNKRHTSTLDASSTRLMDKLFTHFTPFWREEWREKREKAHEYLPQK